MNSILINFLLLLSLLSLSSADLQTDFIKCLTSKRIANASAIVYSPTNPSFKGVLDDYVRNLRFKRTTTPKPAFIVTPKLETDVGAIIVCLNTLGKIQVRIRSGGHDYEGLSYVSNAPFVVLDLFNIRSITVDASAKTAWAQAGATLGELYYQLGKHPGLGFPAGVCPTVGIGGHISGGGYGNMLRKYGLAVDNIIDAKIVNVNGQLLNRASMGEDLFWAIKGGGGGSFGVVIAYKLNLVAVPAVVTTFRIEKTLEQNATAIVYKWQNAIPKMDRNLFMRMLIQPTKSEVSKTPTVKTTFIAQFLGDSKTLLALMDTGFPELGVKKPDCQEMSWIQSVLIWNNMGIGSTEQLLSRVPDSVKYLKRKSDYVKTPIPIAGLTALWNNLMKGKVGLVFNSYGGKMDEIESTATPFPHRAGNLFKIQYSANWKEDTMDMEKMYLDQIRSVYTFMTPYVSKNPRSAFLNYRDIDIGVNSFGKDSYKEGRVYGEKYFGGNFDRLVKIKTAVDPTNFFRNEQSIPVLKFKKRLDSM